MARFPITDGPRTGHTASGKVSSAQLPATVITDPVLRAYAGRTPHGLAADFTGLLDANVDGNNPGGGTNAPLRLVLGNGVGGPMTVANGLNGTRGDPINIDTGNFDGTFFAPMLVQCDNFNTRGSWQGYTSTITVNEIGAGGVYHEAGAYEASVTTSSKGAYTAGSEVLNHITAAKPARANGYVAAIQEDNLLSTYPTALGADSTTNTYSVSGARGFAAHSTGAQAAGTAFYVDGAWVNGIMFRVATTTLLLQNRNFGDTNPRVQVDGNGKISWGAGAGATDANLYRIAGGLVGTDSNFYVAGQLQVNGFLNHSGTTLGFYNHVAATQPAAPVTLADVIAVIRGCGLSA